jgi:hypothetical protein
MRLYPILVKKIAVKGLQMLTIFSYEIINLFAIIIIKVIM